MAISTLSFTDRTQAERVAATLVASVLVVKEKRVQTLEEAPPSPYTTLTLLEDATFRYGWSGEHAMQIAQSLFEQGLITYPAYRFNSYGPNRAGNRLVAGARTIWCGCRGQDYTNGRRPGCHRRSARSHPANRARCVSGANSLAAG